MTSLYWVGTDQDWHTDSNWSLSSGGPGDGWEPTSLDDVIIDGNGYTICWATSPFVCANFTVDAAATEYCFIDQGGIINGDFSMAAGYFGPTGGGGYTVEFKGDYLNTGGTFAVGTGTGVDPTCEFSGTSKTYVHDNASAATYQNVLISGSYEFSGTRLSVMYISQELNITGTMEIVSGNRVDLVGSFGSISGTLMGAGRFWWSYESDDEVPSGGTISIRYFRYEMVDSTVTLYPRTFSTACEVEIEYTLNNQTCVFDGSARHYYHKVTIYADDSAINAATWDCSTNDAEIWVHDIFMTDIDAFPNGTFTMNWGNGTQVFRSSVNLYFSYSSTTSHLVVDPGQGTILLYPRGLILL